MGECLVADGYLELEAQPLAAKAEGLGCELLHGYACIGVGSDGVGRAPLLDGRRARLDEFHRAVQSGSRIPAAALLQVLQVHGQRVLLAVLMYIRCDVDVEGVVAVLPFAGLLAVHIDFGFGHGAVEVEQGTLAALLHAEVGAVPSAADPGQRAAAPGLLRGLLLAVLLDGHHLLVDVLVEGSGDGPVVGHADGFPLRVVILLFGRSRLVEFLGPGELPPLRQDGLPALRLCADGARRQQKDCCEVPECLVSVHVRMCLIVGKYTGFS